jgi:hypothetical protein
MISPTYYRDARMSATHHIQAKIKRPSFNGAEIKIVRVFRGPLKRGAILDLRLHFRPEGILQSGGPLYSDHDAFEKARYVEAFLHGDPPVVVLEQVKFLPSWTWWPTGRPVGSELRLVSATTAASRRRAAALRKAGPARD